MSHKKAFLTGKILLWLGVASPVFLSAVLTASPIVAQSSKSSSSNNSQFELPADLAENIKVRIDGSSSMSVINNSLKERFQKQFFKTEVILNKNGTDKALAALVKGEIDVAAIGRPLTAEEKAKGLVYVPISREKIAIVVGKDNPFEGDITFEQFAQIFRGEITDWSELGGNSGQIRLIDRPAISDTREAFRSYPIFKNAKFATGKNAQQLNLDSTEAVVRELGKDGIGYAIASQVMNSKDVRIISMHKTLPDDSRYPFSQPRGYVYRKNPNQGTKAFLAFASTTAGKEAISAAKATEEKAGIKWESTIVNTPVNTPDASTSKQEATPAQTTVKSQTAVNTSDTNTSKQETTPAQTPATSQTAINTSDRNTSQETTNQTKTAFLQDGTGATSAAEERTLPWWVWLLAGVPMLGGLLWWLLGKGRDEGTTATTAMAGAGTAGAVAAGAAATPEAQSRIVLVPRNSEDAYAYWEVPPTAHQTMKKWGGKLLKLRLYDVTNMANGKRQTPNNWEEFDCDPEVVDRHIPISVADRDYIVDLGYVSDDNQWLQLARSNHIRVPATVADIANTPGTDEAATTDVDNVINTALGALAGGAAVAGIASPTQSFLSDRHSSQAAESRIVLVPRTSKGAYAYWEVAEADKVTLRQQGGQHPALRISDVTDINLETQVPESYQQYDWDEQSQDMHISLPETGRDYVAELGYVTVNGEWLQLARSESIHVVEADISTVDESATTSVENDIGTAASILAGGAAVAGIAGATGSFLGDRTSPQPQPQQESRIVIVPRDSQELYAYWEVSQADKAALRQQGGQHPALRIFEVTDIDSDGEAPASYQEYDWDEESQDMHISLPETVGDYVGELGYVTADNKWLQLAKSQVIHVAGNNPLVDVESETSTVNEAASTSLENDTTIQDTALTGDVAVAGIANTPDDALTTNEPAPTSIENDISTAASILAGGAAVAGIAGATGSFLGDRTSPQPQQESRIVLVPRDSQELYAYWEVSQADKAALRQQGGQHPALRIFEVTDIDSESQAPASYQQYDWDEQSQDMHISLPQTGGDYVAELGYVTADNKWLKLARSPRVFFPGTHIDENIPGSIANSGIIAPQEQLQKDCTITDVRVDSKANCYSLTPERMQQLQQTSVTHTLQPGLHLVRIKGGDFNFYPASGLQGEPLVMLWIFGGKVVNKKTNKEVSSTWSSLNGYADLLTLEVLETATLCAFFFDSYVEDNEGEITLSVVQI